MAGQVRHNILAADDDAMVDRNWSSPLADLILEIRGKTGAASRRDDAVVDAQGVERRRAKDDLAARDVALYDQRIEEGEIEASPALVARLLAMAQIRDPRGLSLEAAHIAALLRRPSEVTMIPSPVDYAMADNGMAMPRSHPDRRRLALDLLRAEVAAHHIVARRRAGDPTPTPERPATLEPPVAGPDAFRSARALDRALQAEAEGVRRQQALPRRLHRDLRRPSGRRRDPEDDPRIPRPPQEAPAQHAESRRQAFGQLQPEALPH